MNIQLRNTKDELAPLRLVYKLANDILAPIDRTSPAYLGLLESIALSRLDMVARALKKFVSVNCNRIPLFSRGLILHLAVQLEKGNLSTLKTATQQLREYHRSLDLWR